MTMTMIEKAKALNVTRRQASKIAAGRITLHDAHEVNRRLSRNSPPTYPREVGVKP